MPVIPLLRIKFYTMYQKAQDNFIDPGLLSSLKRKVIPGKPRIVDSRQL